MPPLEGICGDEGREPTQRSSAAEALASGLVAPVSGGGGAVKFARFEAEAGEMVEIVVGDVVVRVSGEVEAERLATVIRAVLQA